MSDRFGWEEGQFIVKRDSADSLRKDAGEVWKNRGGKMPLAHPGEQIQCRCQAIAYMADIIAEAKQEMEE